MKLLALLAAAALLYHLVRSGGLFRRHGGEPRRGRERRPTAVDQRDDRDVADAEFRDLEP